MPSFHEISAPSIAAAMREFDEIGRTTFLEKYGFGRARKFFVVDGGKFYDSKALVGAAHQKQFGTPLRSADFSGGLATVVALLESLGFTVINDPQLNP